MHGLADAQRTRRVGQLYLAYWSSLQLDRHSDSLALAGLMVDLSDPADRLYVVESVSLTTEQDLAGLRSLSDEPIEESIPSHAAAFRLIEEGRDAEALAGLRPFIERSGPKQSRSAIDALVLLVRAQSDPAGLGSDEVRKVVRRSRRLWRDRRPSSFIAWAATVAVSIPGLEQGADALPEDPVGDGLFDALTRCARALRDGRHKEALAQCEGREELDFPRFEMIARVYVAAAQIHLDNPDGACQELALGWRRVPSRRLLRFALRLIPAATAERLTTAAHGSAEPLPSGLREALAEAEADARPVTWEDPPTLTRSEREILRLMQRGSRNSEIAAARFVTLGTLRSQIKPLYRKLGAADRAEALSVAARLRLLEGDH